MNDVVSRLPMRHVRRRSMAERIRQFRRRDFVGRAKEREVVAAALREEPDAPRILFVYGPGGIGKSALLRQLADDASEAGCSVTLIDGQNVGTSSDDFAREAGLVHTAAKPVLLVDAFEYCQVLETWLREEFLLTVPENTVVVMAGRNRPEPQWTLEPGLRNLVRLLPLEPLSAEDTAVLLDTWQVPGHMRDGLISFAAGHPLALCLAAQTVASTTSPDAVEWKPSPDVVRTLLTHLVDQVPSPMHEYALRVCGHVRYTTVDLLRTGLSEEDAVAAFEWLSGLPYVERGPHGLLPHELVRDVLDTDFAWRDPRAYAELHESLWLYLGKRAWALTGDAVAVAVADLFYLTRYSHNLRGAQLAAFSGSGLFEREYTVDLREDVLRLARQDQGDECAELVAYWLDRRPESFYVYCNADDRKPISFLAWFRFDKVTDDEASADPIIAAMAEHARQSGALQPGQFVGIARFSLPATLPGQHTARARHHGVRITTELFQHQYGLAEHYLVLPDAYSFEPDVTPFGFLPARTVRDARGREWGLFVHDLRKIPLALNLERTVPPLWSSTGKSASRGLARWLVPVPLAREEHDEAVKQALRDWFDDDAVAMNPLVRVHGDGAVVRKAISDAIAALDNDPPLGQTSSSAPGNVPGAKHFPGSGGGPDRDAVRYLPPVPPGWSGSGL